jgi:AraC-like DNA-binding protein
MTPRQFPLAIHYVRQIAEQIADCGGDVGQWLGLSGLTRAQIADPAFELSFPRFRQLVRDGLDTTREPALGLLVGDRLTASAHGMLGYAALNSGTLRQAIDLVQRYLPVRTSLVTVRQEASGRSMRILFEEVEPLGDLRTAVFEAVILTIKNMIETVCLGTSPIESIAFPFPAPAYAGLARALFKTDLAYGASWAGFSIPLELIDMPLRQADPAAFEDARQICQRELDKLTRQMSLAARLRRLLLDRQGGYPTLTVAARLFNMTPRTLHRRLVDEGTSFRDVLDGVRHTLAVEHLKSSHLTIDEIAYTLGYGELANFRRAFKRWEGLAPSDFRRRTRGA